MNLIRYYNKNRKKIWGILAIIIFAFSLFQIVEMIVNKNREEELAMNYNHINTVNISTENSKVMTNQSVITGENVSTTQLKIDTSVIDEFISYCNEKNLEKAYELLTDECKEQMYKTLEAFEQAYYNDIFKGEKMNCSIENWVNDTYKVKIFEDMLSTGQINNEYAKQDYITVKKVEDEYKLNINSYIGNTEINEETKREDININVIAKDTYMDYEEYTIKVTNNTGKDILLDSKASIDTLYLEDKNEKKYYSYSNELTKPMLEVPKGQTKELTIKFYSSYVSTKRIRNIVFSDLILYDGELSEKTMIKVNV